MPSGSRHGKKAIAGFFDPAVSRQLKQIGLEKDRSVQELLREALNDLFQKYGRHPLRNERFSQPNRALGARQCAVGRELIEYFDGNGYQDLLF